MVMAEREPPRLAHLAKAELRFGGRGEEEEKERQALHGGDANTAFSAEPLIRTLSGCSASTFSNTILSVEVIGTARIIPQAPHSQPQKMRESSTSTGLRSRLCPMNRGSSMLPMMNWTARLIAATSSAQPVDSNCRSMNTVGRPTEITAPTVG